MVVLAPWQFALINHIDISLHKSALQGRELSRYLNVWRAKERHSGCVVAPRLYQETRNTYPGPVVQSFNFGLLSVLPCEDAVSVSLQTKCSWYPDPLGNPRARHNDIISTARAMRARPITHLTLRILRRDWWYLGENYDSFGSTAKIGLDPAFGGSNWPFCETLGHEQMIALARERLAGIFPNPYHKDPPPQKYEGTWGEVISKLPDIKELILVLEVFIEGKQQLDIITECAQTWRFPIEGMLNTELVYDGHEEKTWRSDLSFEQERWRARELDSSHYQSEEQREAFREAGRRAGAVRGPEPNVEVRIIRFKRVTC
jgi:hypothetical protein